MARKECCIGRGVSAFRHKYRDIFYTYTYFKLRSLMDKIKKFNDEGTVFGSIGKTDFQQMKIVLPPENLIENFGADGIHHGVTSNWIIESNTVKNFRRNSNFDQHADGIQCEIPCDNTTIRNNIFIHFDYSDNDWGFTGPIGSTTPNPNNLFDEHQGIFGTYPNSIIENNLVLVSHVANGIRANGENLQVINNILIDPTQREQPGIILLPAYGGEIIRNNIANVITVDASMTEDHNIDLRDYSQNYSLFFADFANYDFHHSSGSPAIDVGSSDLAPFYDIEGTFRPQGSDWDLGPYEYIA